MNQLNGSSKQIMEWLKEEHAGFVQLFSILEKQKKCVDQYNESGLLEVIQEKERIMGRLHEVGQKIYQAVDSLPRDEHNQLIKKSQTLRDEIESFLTRILDLETYCEKSLEEMKSDIHGQVKSFRQNRNVLKGYGASFLKRSSFSKNV